MSQNFINALQVTDGLVGGFVRAMDQVRQRLIDREYESSAVLSYRLKTVLNESIKAIRKLDAENAFLRSQLADERRRLHEMTAAYASLRFRSGQ